MKSKVKLEINDPKGFFYIENDGEIQAKWVLFMLSQELSTTIR
jgi:hypothetical protein